MKKILIIVSIFLVGCSGQQIREATACNTCVSDFVNCYNTIEKCKTECNNIYQTYKESISTLKEEDYYKTRQETAKLIDCNNECVVTINECDTKKESCIQKLISEVR